MDDKGRNCFTDENGISRMYSTRECISERLQVVSAEFWRTVIRGVNARRSFTDLQILTG